MAQEQDPIMRANFNCHPETYYALRKLALEKRVRARVIILHALRSTYKEMEDVINEHEKRLP